MLTDRSFPNPPLRRGVAMAYRRYLDSLEYVGVVPKELTEEVIGVGHVLIEDQSRRIKPLNTTQLLLAELKLDLSHTLKVHRIKRAQLIAKIGEIEIRIGVN